MTVVWVQHPRVQGNPTAQRCHLQRWGGRNGSLCSTRQPAAGLTQAKSTATRCLQCCCESHFPVLNRETGWHHLLFTGAVWDRMVCPTPSQAASQAYPNIPLCLKPFSLCRTGFQPPACLPCLREMGDAAVMCWCSLYIYSCASVGISWAQAGGISVLWGTQAGTCLTLCLGLPPPQGWQTVSAEPERCSSRRNVGHSGGLTGRWKEKQMWSRCSVRTVLDLQYS